MNSATGFVHDIDPVLLLVGPVPTYWYGFAYSLGRSLRAFSARGDEF